MDAWVPGTLQTHTWEAGGEGMGGMSSWEDSLSQAPHMAGPARYTEDPCPLPAA